MGLGAVLGGLWVARASGAFDMARTLRLQLWVAAAAAAFALSPSIWLGIPAIAAFGFVLVACGVGLHTAIQMGVEPALRGRVMSFFGLVFRSVPALGALATGALAEAIGLRAATLVAAVVFILVYIWLQRRLVAKGD